MRAAAEGFPSAWARLSSLAWSLSWARLGWDGRDRVGMTLLSHSPVVRLRAERSVIGLYLARQAGPRSLPAGGRRPARSVPRLGRGSSGVRGGRVGAGGAARAASILAEPRCGPGPVSPWAGRGRLSNSAAPDRLPTDHEVQLPLLEVVMKYRSEERRVGK